MLLVAGLLAQEVFRHMAGIGTIHSGVPVQAATASCHPAQQAPVFSAPHCGFELKGVPGPS